MKPQQLAAIHHQISCTITIKSAKSLADARSTTYGQTPRRMPFLEQEP